MIEDPYIRISACPNSFDSSLEFIPMEHLKLELNSVVSLHI